MSDFSELSTRRLINNLIRTVVLMERLRSAVHHRDMFDGQEQIKKTHADLEKRELELFREIHKRGKLEHEDGLDD